MSKSKELWELTDEEAAEEAHLLEDERRAADRADAPMYAEMHAFKNVFLNLSRTPERREQLRQRLTKEREHPRHGWSVNPPSRLKRFWLWLWSRWQ